MPKLCWIALTVAAVGLIVVISLPAAWVTTASCWRPELTFGRSASKVGA